MTSADFPRYPLGSAAGEPDPSVPRVGLFIALEGGDGAGKSTQIKRLARGLAQGGLEVLTTREPGGSDLGERLRNLVLDPQFAPVDPRTEALLFAASRSSHVETVIRPALERGAVVITDRFLDSSVAYQGAGRGLGTSVIRDLNAWAVHGVMPDLTVLLDVSAATGRQRRSTRAEDRMEQESQDFHHDVRQAFLALAQDSPQRYLVLAADQPIPVLAQQISERVTQLLAERNLGDQAAAGRSTP
ncbi:dTMP kinase [Kocuria sp. ZOR0020]|uniref:dTMP kinase n=1 Tax=Kocuria sp. ZOR0020 TaxID=1339234 RepID=UPI00350EE882